MKKAEKTPIDPLTGRRIKHGPTSSSSTQFTPGPWGVGPETTWEIRVPSLRGRSVPIYELSHTQPDWATANNKPGNHRHPIVAEVTICDETQANAALIAAAPDMYWVLDRVARELNSNLDYEVQLEQDAKTEREAQLHRNRASHLRKQALEVMNVIAKARGEK